MKRELLPDRRQRFPLQEVARVLVGAARRLAIRALRHGPFVTGHARPPRPIELAGRESESDDALQLGDEGVEAAAHAVVGDDRLQNGFVTGPRRRKERRGPRRPSGMAGSRSG